MDRLLLALIVSVLAVPCSAAIITVDDSGAADYRTIQEAINNAQDGDTIVVKPGTYREQVSFIGRRVTVRSDDPNDPAVVEATVIAASSGSSVFFDFGEGNLSVLEGFTTPGDHLQERGARLRRRRYRRREQLRADDRRQYDRLQCPGRNPRMPWADSGQHHLTKRDGPGLL